MSSFATISVENGIATVALDSNSDKINILGPEPLAELDALADKIAENTDIAGVILLSNKPGGFVAGADIGLIESVTDAGVGENLAARGQETFNKWSQLECPVIALLHGHCLGGGTELALACDFRLADTDLKIGLPEVKLGILPGFGGTQRLPALIGLEDALDLLLTGRTLSAKQAQARGLVDVVLDHDKLLEEARRLLEKPNELHKLVKARNKWSLRRLFLEKTPPGRAILFSQARKSILHKTAGHYPAPLKILDTIQQTRKLTLTKGLQIEAKALGQLITTSECKNLVHLFHLSQRAKQTFTAPPPILVKQAAVVGAGIMGGGIAGLLASHNIPVRLKDINDQAVAAGLEHARQLLTRKHHDKTETNATNLITGQLDFAGFEQIDLVIEAAVEKISIKQEILQEAEAKVTRAAIFASNTSALSITDIQSAGTHPGRVAGLHFFNPVDKMPLVEVIAGRQTKQATISSLVALVLRLGKIPVLVADQPGFLVNRLLGVMLAEACLLAEAGTSWHSLDQQAIKFGWPMGPFRLIDEVGLDVAIDVGQTLTAAYPYLKKSSLLNQMLAKQWIGRKSGAGFYRYADGHATEINPNGWPLQPNRPADNMDVRRLLLIMVNEAARCLEDGVVESAADIDTGLVFGTGFPAFRGGLCRWADHEGVKLLVRELMELANQHGSRFLPAVYLTEQSSFYRPEASHTQSSQ